MFKVTSGPVLREYTAPESFDAYQYLYYLRSRFRFILIVCVAAGVLALILSLLLPKEYTAAARILIEQPATGDPRASMALNPTYLESLRSYEVFASSDTLFRRALDKFHLRDSRPQTPIESLKRGILKVTKLRDTNILEINTTMSDPVKAQALAQFLAEETVNLNRSSNRENDRDLLELAQRQASEARTQVEREQAAWRELNAHEPLDGVRAEMETLIGSRKLLRQDLADSKAELAEYAGRPDDPRLSGARARVDSLEKQDVELGRQIDAKAPLLAGREVRADELERRLRVARTTQDTVEARVRDLLAIEGQHNERLRVMDPGVVPERPSAPNVGLNVALALAVALMACLTYLTLTFRPLTNARSPQT